MGLVLAHRCPDGWPPAGRPGVVGNAPAFVDELRGYGGGGSVFVACCWPPQAAVVPRPVPAWGRSTS